MTTSETIDAAHPSLDVVTEYHRAWTSGDVDRALTFVADDVVCRAPGEPEMDKAAWRAYLGGFAPLLTGLTDIARVAEGEQVVLCYCPHTANTTDAPVAERFTVRGGLIADVLLVFDRLSFAPPASS